MPDLNNIKIEVTDMAKLTLKMWQTTFATFMEHDLDLVSRVLEEENKLNNYEKEITQKLIELTRTCRQAAERTNALIYTDVVGDLELIGDYCKDILERVQIKIEEKLMFSDEAVQEYGDLYRKTEKGLKETVEALDKDKPALVKQVLKEREQIDKLVEEYRRRHDQRLIDGICSPLACNMFLNMLDFTAQVAHHTEVIAKNLLKLK